MSGPPPTPEAPDTPDVPIARLAVVGAGLVGGSVALAAMEAGVEQVVLTDASESVRQRARELGLGHEVRDTVADTVADADLVVVAIPSHQVPPVVEEIANHINMQSIVTDAASLKSRLVPEVERRLATFGDVSRNFVGGHPMAGSEASGPDAADGKLFQGATWVLTPTERTDDVALRRLSGFLSRLGARVLVVSPDRHDRLVAVVSHLPQVAASCLADVAGEAVATSGQAVLALAGGGFRDTTRIAASDPDLWLGILGGNREAVLEALASYRASLDELASALSSQDDSALRTKLERASQARRRLVPKDGPREVVDLVVALEDQPGALAIATGVLGEAGINIEDLAMRHAAAGERGALLVRVEATAAQRGLRALHEHGLSAHLERDEPGGGEGPDAVGAPPG
jgi:prephenate dehydrogenase